MAQTKKRRTTKHRGNAAGMVETRGRTGRKPRPDERKGGGSTSMSAKDRRLERLNRPPSWRSAINKAALAALVLFVLSVTLLGQTVAQAATLVPFLFAVYVPLGYYTDGWIYKRHQRRQVKR
jgi:Flp pilus assembly protein TadB